MQRVKEDREEYKNISTILDVRFRSKDLWDTMLRGGACVLPRYSSAFYVNICTFVPVN